MIHIDHVCLGVQNVYEGALRLTQETGLGNYEGGWFPRLGLANRIVPSGSDTYIEVESVVDTFELENGNEVSRFFHDACVGGDVFIGWCGRVDTRAELEAISRRTGAPIIEGGLRTRPDGRTGNAIRTPDTIYCWQAGLPNFFLVEDMALHPARQPTQFGTRKALSLNYLELGGTAEELSDFVGTDISSLNLRFNGKAHGVHSMGIQTDQGEVVITRRVLAGTTGKLANLGASM